MKFNKAEKAVKKMGDAVIKRSREDYAEEKDLITREIMEYKAKYGKEWFHYYTKDVFKLAQKEQKQAKKGVNHDKV